MHSQRIIIESYIYVQWSCYQGDRRKPHKQALVLLAIDYIALISRERILFSLLFSILSMIWAPSVMQGKDQREAGSRLITFPLFFFSSHCLPCVPSKCVTLKQFGTIPGAWSLTNMIYTWFGKSRRIFCTVCGSAEGLDWRLDFSSNFKTRLHFHIFTNPTCRTH